MSVPVTAAGCIRNNDDSLGWVLHETSRHDNVGISSISTLTDRIVMYCPNTFGVRTFIVTPDNNLAEEGITVGISGGGSEVHIFMFSRSGAKLNPWNVNTTTVPASNIWFIGCQIV